MKIDSENVHPSQKQIRANPPTHPIDKINPRHARSHSHKNVN